MDRRSFLGKSAKIGVGLVGGSVLLSACASGDKSGKMTPLRQPGEYYVPELRFDVCFGSGLVCRPS